jgi:hypothetical protein
VAWLPHALGLLGELLNLTGAVFMGCDLLLRPRQRTEEDRLKSLNAFGMGNNLNNIQFKDQDISRPGLPQAVQAREAARLGLWGIGLMASGFLMLAAYHVLEICLELQKVQP